MVSFLLVMLVRIITLIFGMSGNGINLQFLSMSFKFNDMEINEYRFVFLKMASIYTAVQRIQK